MAAHQASGGEPRPPNDAMAIDRDGGILGARRQEPAGARKVWRKQNLIAPQHAECDPDGVPRLSGGGDGGR